MPVANKEADPFQELEKDLENHVPLEEAPVGIYTNISFERYCGIKAVNNSRLSLMRKSPLHYQHGRVEDASPAFAFGSLAHCGRLEPEKLQERYVVIPDFHLDKENVTKDGSQSTSTATTYYKTKLAAFKSQHPDKQEVSSEWMTRMANMIENMDNHPLAGPLFKKGISEVTLIWEDKATKLKCKARIDWLSGPSPGMSPAEIIKSAKVIVDLKTTEDIFNFTLDKWNYHQQAAFYIEGWKVLAKKLLPFNFVAAEKAPPHSIRSAPAAKADLDTGRDEIRDLLNRVAVCMRDSKWPGPTDPIEWTTSKYYKPFEYKNYHLTTK